MTGRRLLKTGVVMVLGLALAAAFLLGNDRSLVDWSRVRALTIESDDWGFAGFVPAAGAWDGIDRQALAPGRFPDAYWGSTLEDSSSVAALCEVFARFRGRDGQPVVFQPNYVLSSLALATDGRWQRYDLPDLPPHYARPGLWSAVDAGRNAGLWYPEYHAAWHYDPERRRGAVQQSPLARQVAERGIVLFPGSERARELGHWRSPTELGQELDTGLRIFESIFDRSAGSVIAPDYTWDADLEELWLSRDIRVIQGKREQRNPGYGGGLSGRIRKLLVRNWTRLVCADRRYLERNVRLEPVQAADPQSVVEDCVAQVEKAWRRGEPAIVETHRINFAHTDADVAAMGRRALANFLERAHVIADVPPLYLTDSELAQLARRGVSWCLRGHRLVLHNQSHTRRILPLPATIVGRLEANGIGHRDRLVALGAGESVVIELYTP